MAIDSLNSTSAEQLLAMSMIGNGQTTSSDLSSSVDESDIAFETVMQNLVNQSSNGDSSTNDMSTEQLLAMSLMSNGQLTSGENSSESRDMSNQMSLATALMMKSLQESKTSNSNASDKNVVEQTCPTGQDLEKLAMIVNGRPVNYNYSSFTSDNISPADKEQIYAAVKEAAKKYGVNENLILAIIKQESNFNSTAVSNAGAMGLMQVMPANFSSVNITNPYDVNQNVNGGTKILKECLDRFNGNIDMALMAYNGGSGNMQRRGVNSSSDLYKMPVETQKYVPSVLSYYRNGF